jgi:hypothetical protein
MKLINLIIIGLIFVNGIFAQEVKTDKELKKEASQKKKEEKKAQLENQYLAIGQLLDSKRFVMEAQYLNNRRGNLIPVSSILNFIKVDSSYGIVQTGSPQGIGYNGVGGVTAQGRIVNWKLDKNDKRKTFDLFMTLSCNIGVYDIAMSVNYLGYATVSLTGLRSGKLLFEGNLVPTNESNVYKGQSY